MVIVADKIEQRLRDVEKAEGGDVAQKKGPPLNAGNSQPTLLAIDVVRKKTFQYAG